MSPKDGELLLLSKRNKHLLAPARMLGCLALLFSLPLEALSGDFAAVGVVDASSCGLRSVSVLGVSFTAKDQAIADELCASKPQPGLAFVAVVGVLNDQGALELKEFNLLSSEEYVPGVSSVYLRGRVSWSNPLTGKFSIGGAEIAAGDLTPLVGEDVEVVGSQPIGRGVILSDIVLPAGLALRRELFNASTNSSVGSGVLGSSASLNSSVGSGKLGSSASLNSSVGSGVLGSSASLNSSVGSGVLGSSASLNSSVGSGQLGSSASLNSSVGSGVLGSSASLNSSVGSGKLGSSASLNSSVGSGVLGSSASLNSSVGSGVLGSSASLNSSVGSGKLSSSEAGF